MPNAKDNAKGTGDVHPPEVEDMDEAPLAREEQDEARPGKGINQAGYLKEKDAPAAGGSDQS
jgi:hypothetical protein